MNPVNYYAQRLTVVVRTQPELTIIPTPIARPIFYPQTQMIYQQAPSIVYFPTTLPHQQRYQESATQTPDIPATPPPSPAASSTSAANPPPEPGSSPPENKILESLAQKNLELPSLNPHIQVSPSFEIHVGQALPPGERASSSAQPNAAAAAPSASAPANAPAPNSAVPPPPVPLPMLPAPDGIAIPPPPQETTPAAQSTNTQNKKCGSRCNCGPVNKTYLVYAMIAVCASLVIALVPTLVTLLAKPKA